MPTRIQTKIHSDGPNYRSREVIPAEIVGQLVWLLSVKLYQGALTSANSVIFPPVDMPEYQTVSLQVQPEADETYTKKCEKGA